MASLSTPSSITLTNPISTAWGTIVPSNDSNLDTATKKHYSAGAAGVTDVFFELSNGVITVDVNSSPTGGSPQFVSKTGSTSGGSSSITVTTGDTVYLYNPGSAIGSFVWQSGWTSSGGGTSSEGVPVYDMNKDRLLISGLSHGTYQLNASFGNGDVWTFTVPTTQSYTLYADSSDASPANVDSLDKFSPGIYWLNNMGGFQLATFTVSSNKKVFCNFW